MKNIARFASLLTLLIAPLTPAISSANPLEEEKRLSQEYLATMALEPGAETLESGIVMRTLHTSNDKRQPELTNEVKVVYQLFDRTGRLVDDGFATDEVPVFPLQKLIRCWQMAVPKMTVGSLAKISCPSATAYGDKGVPDAIAPGAALTFRLVLLDIVTPPARSEKH